VYASVKDSDADGLTDVAETDLYFTNPTNSDTDGDGISDLQEIKQGTNPLVMNVTSSLARQLQMDDQLPLAWYIGRASGILAFILLTIVVVNGLLMTTRLVFRFLPPALNYEMHRFFSWMALIAVMGHFVSFTFDTYLKITLAEGLIPFTLIRDFPSLSGYSLRWAIGIGTVAMYGIIAQVLTSQLKGRFIGLKPWRRLHYLGFPTYLLFLAHGFFSGTDSQSWWMIWLYNLSAGLVSSLVVLRIIASIRKRRETAVQATADQNTRQL
jgi:predicted ferric reductase